MTGTMIDGLTVDKPWLMLGDCLERMREIPDGSVDAIICDLPYGTTACAWDTVVPLAPLWDQYKRVAKPRAAIVLTATQPFTSVLVMSNPKLFRYEWIWRKNQGVNPMCAKSQPLRNHENVVVFYKSAPTYNPQMWQSTPYGSFVTKSGKQLGEAYSTGYAHHRSRHRDNPTGNRYPLTVQDFSMEKGLHPTQKPVLLFEYLIQTYTTPGETVLDNCFGSGTTGVACVNTGRRFIGIEKHEPYFDIGRRRIAEAIATAAQPAPPRRAFSCAGRRRMTGQTFTISIVEKNRKVRVSYTRDGQYHVYTSPDVNGSTFFSSSKTKAYEGFVRRLKEML